MTGRWHHGPGRPCGGTGACVGRRPLVVGVGNPDRGDDGVGPAVAGAVAADERAADVDVIAVAGDLSELILRWRSDQDVIVVDAVVGAGPPGTVVELDGLRQPFPTDPAPLTSHGVGLAEVVALARSVDRLPRSLTILGIEAASCERFGPMSPAVRSATRHAAERILAHLDHLVTGLGDCPERIMTRADGREEDHRP